MTPDCVIDEGARVTRAVVVDLATDRKGDRLVRLSFSSEEPILREFPFGAGWELLSHSPEDVDMSRFAAGSAPLLKDHRRDLDSMVGTVTRAWIAGGRGQAVVRFSETATGSEMLARVRAGEVQSVSVGYQVLQYSREGERDGLPIVRVRWMPYEISLVAIPADALVGVGRSMAPVDPKIQSQKENDMTTQTEVTRTDEGSRTAVNTERNRAAEINSIGRQFEVPDDQVAAAISDGTSVDRFRALVMDHLDSSAPRSQGSGAALMAGRRAQERPYSLTRAINAELSGNWRDAGFERECAEEMTRSMGRRATGFYVPPAAIATRDLLTTSNAASLIGTEHMSSQFIDALKPSIQVMELGATVLAGLVENVSIPRMPAGTSAKWIAEDAAAFESTPVFDSVSLTLKQLSARTRMSRRQLKQSLPALDMLLQNDLRREIAIAVDRAAINGAGTAVEPRGVLKTPGIGTLTADGANGRTLTWAHVMDLMAQVENANTPGQGLAFLSNPKVKAKMLSTARFPSGGDTSILTAASGGLFVADHRAAFTTLVPSNLTRGTGVNLSGLIFGAWSELLIGQWGGVDIIVDDKTESDRGNVRITAHSEWDINVRNANSFAAVTDLIAG